MKNELLLKQEEILTLNRNMKFTRMHEMETENKELQQEI